ncbi:MAG: TlpA family protein disulfide reductase [Acidobacteria bacterium]|nr:TlpA family protein disulfide reductase [Acidobacteriota bacterium]
MLKKLVLLAALAASCFAVTVPRPSGEVDFTVPGKGPMKLSSYQGKIVVVMVFITTCPHCQRTTKLMSKIQNEYRAKGVQVIQLAFRDDDNKAAIEKFVQEYKPTYPVGMIDANLLAKWGQLTAEMRPTVPMLFFIDRHGYIVGQYMGAEPFMIEENQPNTIRAKLNDMVQKQPPAGAKKAAPAPAAKK